MAHKILIVDDEPDLVESCARFLGLKGYKCFRAFCRIDAFNEIDLHAPEMVLTDLHLPDGNGIEIANYVRVRIPKSQVVVMTAYHSPDAARDAASAGVVGYLRKPFAMVELGEIVERAFAGETVVR